MQITITVTCLLFAREGSSWYLMTCDLDGQKLVCKGKMGWKPAEMEMLTLIGEYVVYHGERQFQFSEAKLTLPVDPRSQLHYICERTNGIGAATEQKIWDAKGDQFRDLQFGEIKGLKQEALESFKAQIAQFGENKEKAEAIAYLEDHGCTPNMATAAWEEWGTDAPGKVNENCYCLAWLKGFSFKTVEENVRRFYNIADHDPRRVDAAMRYAYDTASQENGDTVILWNVWYDAIFKLLPDYGTERITERANLLIEQGVIFILGDCVSYACDYQPERDVSDFITGTAGETFDASSVTDEALAEGESFTPDESQLEAVRFAISRRVAIINGGAGVGKTTVIRMIVRGLNAQGIRAVRLCAPTGKAAARLKEASGIETSTLHSLLGFNGKNFGVSDLNEIAVIVDESSMVDSSLMAVLMRCRPLRLILVGDQAQLTPVGKGQPFHDIINLHPELVRTLAKCYRNQEAVYQAASAIRSGSIPPMSAVSDHEAWNIIRAEDAESAEAMILNWAKLGEIDFTQDIVLAPKNGEKDAEGNFTRATVNSLNAALLMIDRAQRGCGDEAGKFLPGDRVINTVNHADLHIWNGTTGTVHAVNGYELYLRLDTPIVDDDGNVTDTVRLGKEETRDLQYAYALTCHKSQGSQYRRVIILCLNRDRRMLDRSMLYTAVTRTKAECVVVGSVEALKNGIRTVKHKNTVLQEIGREQ